MYRWQARAIDGHRSSVHRELAMAVSIRWRARQFGGPHRPRSPYPAAGRIQVGSGRIGLALGGRTGEFRAVKTTSAPAPAFTGRRLRASEQVRARDWTVVLALCMGVGSLVLMFMIFWL